MKLQQCGLVLVLGGLMSTSFDLQAQPVYRCGNSYSQTPCEDGHRVDTADQRDKAQKMQADASIKREQKAAEMLEKNRIQQERAASRVARPGSAGEHYAPTYDNGPDRDYGVAPKSGKSPYFTARSMNDKAVEKPAQKKGMAQKATDGNPRP